MPVAQGESLLINHVLLQTVELRIDSWTGLVRTAALTILAVLVLAGCGGGGDIVIDADSNSGSITVVEGEGAGKNPCAAQFGFAAAHQGHCIPRAHGSWPTLSRTIDLRTANP